MTLAPEADIPVAPERSLWARCGALASYIISVSRWRTGLTLGFLVLTSLCENVSLLVLWPVMQFLNSHGGGTVLHIPTGFLAPILGQRLDVELWLVLTLFVAMMAASALFTRFKTIYMAELLSDAINRLRVSLFRSIATARWSYIGRRRTADLDHVLTGDIDRVQTASSNLFLLAQNLIFLCGYVLLSTLVSPVMTLFTAVAGCGLFALMYPIRRYGGLFGNKWTRERMMQYRTISDFLAGLKVTKSFNAEPRYVAELEGTLGRMRGDVLRFTRSNTYGGVIFQSLSAVILCLFIYISYAVLKFPFAKIALLFVIFLRIAPRFTSLQDYFQNIIINLPAFETMQRTKEACDAAVEIQGEDRELTAPRLTRSLAFEEVSFSYGEHPALKNVSFTAPSGRITALVGHSGGGKSTIADLTMGLLVPDSGRILIDGVALDEDSRRAWRSRVAYVQQEAHLLAASIADNLAIAAPGASRDDMRAALTQAQVLGVVDRLPEGLDTKVGDGGIKLSGGERQRLALARALLRKPDLLILDEVTSALDSENTVRIVATIEQLRGAMTVLMITHNPLVAQAADRILTVEDGRVLA